MSGPVLSPILIKSKEEEKKKEKTVEKKKDLSLHLFAALLGCGDSMMTAHE